MAQAPIDARTRGFPGPDGGAFGLVCALREELGSLAERAARRRERFGLVLYEIEVGGQVLIACVGGVGKVNAARAAAALVAEGATRALFVVGVCGALRSRLVPGTLVHCTRAVQTDIARVEGREADADRALRSAWRSVAPGPEGWFLTADRPVLSLWRRLRLARAFAGDCVADMETAAAARIAQGAGVPWAALRAVTDQATGIALAQFKLHYGAQAGRCADTVPDLIARLARSGG